jgi:hypothetical protein
MKKLAVGRVAIVLAAAIISSPASASDVTQMDRDLVERLVRADVGSGRSADGQPVAEYPDARLFLVGSGATRGTTLLVAQYTIETGNAWQLYVAVFDRDTHRLLGKGRVGGKDYREVTIKGVLDGVVHLETKYYGPEDAMCCPSIPGTTSLELRDGQLWETDARIK